MPFAVVVNAFRLMGCTDFTRLLLEHYCWSTKRHTG